MGLKESGLRGSLRNVSVGIDAIPDAGNLYAHYDLQEQSESDGGIIDPLLDQTGNGYDADAVGGPTMDADGFNGNPCAVLDGTEDAWEVPSADWDTLTQPFTMYWVGQIDTTGQTQAIQDNRASSDRVVFRITGDDQFASQAPPPETVGPIDDAATDNISGLIIDGTDSVIESETASTGTSDNLSNDLGPLSLGYENDNQTDFFEGRWVEFAVYNAGHNSATRSEFFDYARSKWGI